MIGFKAVSRRNFSATSCGIVGYPNIGKSTLFNALAKSQQAQAKNYPFCTIDPNVTKVGVHDSNIKKLVAAAKPEKIVPAQIEIWDIAGLIKGASEGAGLGNKFLSNIRSVNAIIHLVRCFKDENIVHVEDAANLNPYSEMDTVQTELILSDLESTSKRAKKKGLSELEKRLWDKVHKNLDNGLPARQNDYTLEELPLLKQLPLLTAKPIIYVCNIDAESMGVGTNDLAEEFKRKVRAVQPDAKVYNVSAQIESELCQLDQQDEKAAKEIREMYNITGNQLDGLLEECSELLSLTKFYTAGPTHVSSWLLPKGSTAAQAAGKIHTSFEKQFILAEVCSVDEWVQFPDEDLLRKKNVLKKLGKESLIEENSVVYIKHSAK